MTTTTRAAARRRASGRARGRRALGLEGRVSAEQFNALIAGADPRDPSRRLRDGQEPKVAALDLTFSAPKSVSVLFAIAGEEVAGELVAAHEAAVRAAVGWLEDTAVQVRRGAQGRVRLPGEGLIAAAYRHRMSRALDPQLHTHVVAANLTRGPDGRFTALFGDAAVPGGEDRRLPVSGASAGRDLRAARARVGSGAEGCRRAQGRADGGA